MVVVVLVVVVRVGTTALDLLACHVSQPPQFDWNCPHCVPAEIRWNKAKQKSKESLSCWDSIVTCDCNAKMNTAEVSRLGEHKRGEDGEGLKVDAL